MKTQIKLKDVDGAKEFVGAAMDCEFDIDVYYNRIARMQNPFLEC